MSVTPTVCMTLAFWLGRGVRSCACAHTQTNATAAEAAKGRNFLCDFISTSPRLVKILTTACGGVPRDDWRLNCWGAGIPARHEREYRTASGSLAGRGS